MSNTAAVAAKVSGHLYHHAGVVKLRDGAPIWMLNLIRDAHEGELPNNWRWNEIDDILNHLAHGKGVEEYVNDFVGDSSDFYLLEWVKVGDRSADVDEAIQDRASGLFEAILQAQVTVAERMAGIVLAALEEVADE